MPIYKRCTGCGKRVSAGTRCPCSRRNQNKEYNKTRSRSNFYDTSEWKSSRELARQHYCGIDIYSLFVLHELAYGYTVHHIIPLEDAPELGLKQSNLIYLSESNHQKIHDMMKEDYYGTIQLLRQIVEMWDQGVGTKDFSFSLSNAAIVFLSQFSE